MDYTKTFALVAKMNIIQIVLSLAVNFGWEVHHMDVKSAFKQGYLGENIYMEQPSGFAQDSNLVQT